MSETTTDDDPSQQAIEQALEGGQHGE